MEPEIGFIRSSWNFICGIETEKPEELSEKEKQDMFAKITSLDEHPIWKRVVSINGFICFSVGVAAFIAFR